MKTRVEKLEANAHVPPSLFEDDPLDLFWDDSPLVEEGDAQGASSPACAVGLWNGSWDRSIDCVRSLAAIIARQPVLLPTLREPEVLRSMATAFLEEEKKAGRANGTAAVNGLFCLAAISAAEGARENASAFTDRAVALLLQDRDLESRETEALLGRLIDLLETLDRKADADSIRRRMKVEKLLLQKSRAGGWSLRFEALKYFEDGDYAAAEPIYRHLIKIGFCLGGTYCHLARVLFLLDRRKDAREAVAEAWMHRSGAVKYELGRIRFFRLLDHMLEGADVRQEILELKAAMEDRGTHNHWIIQPVLDVLKDDLEESQFAFLSALGKALSDRHELEGLEAFGEWAGAALKS